MSQKRQLDSLSAFLALENGALTRKMKKMKTEHAEEKEEMVEIQTATIQKAHEEAANQERHIQAIETEIQRVESLNERQREVIQHQKKEIQKCYTRCAEYNEVMRKMRGDIVYLQQQVAYYKDRHKLDNAALNKYEPNRWRSTMPKTLQQRQIPPSFWGFMGPMKPPGRTPLPKVEEHVPEWGASDTQSVSDTDEDEHSVASQ
jgi:hypothetical protein